MVAGDVRTHDLLAAMLKVKLDQGRTDPIQPATYSTWLVPGMRRAGTMPSSALETGKIGGF